MYQDRTDSSPDEPASVTLTGKDLEDAERLLSLLAQVRRRLAAREELLDPSTQRASANSAAPERADLLACARRVFRARRRREKFFGKAMFGEPAWDMLLALYVNDAESRQNIGQLNRYSGSPLTTSLRWLDYLEKQKLIERESHPTDRRSVFVRITDKGREAMDSYFSETLATEA
jgi:DNA-binding MarR family transcriptional regulator